MTEPAAPYHGRERRSWHSRLVRTLGFRGLIMILFGVGWITRGLAIATGASAAVQALPAWLGAGLWAGTGVAALACAVYLTPRLQALGYALLFIPPAIWSLSYLGAWFVSVVSGDGGVPGAWSSGTAWGIFALLVMIESRRGEPAPPLIHPDRKADDA